MRRIDLDLPGFCLIELDVMSDERGFLLESYQKERFAELGIPDGFVQDNHSHSVRHTLRGLHYQARHPQAKLFCVLRGEVFDVAVDVRTGSPTFGKWTGVNLCGQRPAQIYVPAGFAHGFCVLSDEADVIYKTTRFYDPSDQLGLAWDDPDVGIVWPVTTPLLSPKDRKQPRLREIKATDLPQV